MHLILLPVVPRPSRRIDFQASQSSLKLLPPSYKSSPLLLSVTNYNTSLQSPIVRTHNIFYLQRDLLQHRLVSLN